MLFFKNKESKNIISDTTEFVGTLKTESPVFIYGKLSGVIYTSKDVTIARGAEVKADIKSENLTLSSQFTGNADVERDFEIYENGIYEGELKAGRIIFHQGAKINLSSPQMIDYAEKE